jgi:hypothetical protein
MKRDCSITKAGWFWFCLETVGLSLFLFGLLVTHVVTSLLVRMYFPGRSLLDISFGVLPDGPDFPESIGACVFIFGVTMLGMAYLLPECSRPLFMRRAPVFLGLVGSAYLALLGAAFLLCVFPVSGSHFGDEPASMPLMLEFHWSREFKPLFSSGYWLAGCVVYTATVALLCAWVRLRRRRKAAVMLS